MDPPLVNESSFSAANPSSYSLSEIWPFPVGGGQLGLRVGNLGPGLGGLAENSGHRNGSVEESTVTEQSGEGGGRKRRDMSSEDESSKIASITSGGTDLNNSNGKKMKCSGRQSENENAKPEMEESSAGGSKLAEQKSKPEPPKDYIHVRARRGQATDSHSLAERARREKISERMKILQDLVPGCNKVIGKALVLDEIINYIQSLQRQVEFLSMKLEAVNSRISMTPAIEAFHSKELAPQLFDTTGVMFTPQSARDYAQGPQHEWLHMQIGGNFERTS